MITVPCGFDDYVHAMPPIMFSTGVQLEGIRARLVDFYTRVEKSGVYIDSKCADGLHEIFVDFFLKMADSPDLHDVAMEPYPTRRKRVNSPRDITHLGSVPRDSDPAITSTQDHDAEKTTGVQKPVEHVAQVETTKKRKRMSAFVPREYDLRSKTKKTRT